MSRIGALAVLSLALPPVAAAAADREPSPGPLTLACDGIATNPVGDPTRGGSGRKTSGSGKRGDSAKTRDSDADDDTAATARTTAARTSARGTPVAFRFEFADDRGRVLYPMAIVPIVHSGDHGGWWPIRDLAVSDDAFTGRVLLNFVNHARFTIDRHSGLFNLVGLQANVTGRCARAEPGPRLF